MDASTLVQFLPELATLVTASRRRIIAVDAFEVWHDTDPDVRIRDELDGIVLEMDEADRLIRHVIDVLDGKKEATR